MRCDVKKTTYEDVMWNIPEVWQSLREINDHVSCGGNFVCTPTIEYTDRAGVRRAVPGLFRQASIIIEKLERDLKRFGGCSACVHKRLDDGICKCCDRYDNWKWEGI